MFFAHNQISFLMLCFCQLLYKIDNSIHSVIVQPLSSGILDMIQNTLLNWFFVLKEMCKTGVYCTIIWMPLVYYPYVDNIIICVTVHSLHLMFKYIVFVTFWIFIKKIYKKITKNKNAQGEIFIKNPPELKNSIHSLSYLLFFYVFCHLVIHRS